MVIMVLIMPGAPLRAASESIGVTHLYMIIQSMYPKKASMNNSCGMHSKTKSVLFLKKIELANFRPTPTSICTTPNSTDSFIFIEFTKRSSLLAPAHAGSSPNGYGPCPAWPTSFLELNHALLSISYCAPLMFSGSSKRVEKKAVPMDKKSLYMNPAYTAKNPMKVIK